MKIEACELAEDLMPAAAEGSLSEDSRAFLEEHLKTCPACSALLDALRLQNEQNAERKTSVDRKRRWRMVGLPLIIGVGGLAILVIVLILVMTSGVL